MPLDPVLDIYNIRISRRKNKKESCFRELLQLKFNREESVRDEELFTLFTNKFIYNLDTEDCYQIEGSKKVLTIKPCDTEGNIKKFDSPGLSQKWDNSPFLVYYMPESMENQLMLLQLKTKINNK